MPEARPKRRWYHITPDRLIVGLLAVEGFLLLSEWFQWFAFNEKKGYTVLIAVAAVCVVLVVMLVGLVVSLLFGWRFQFSVRSLVVLVVAVAVPLGWFGVKMREAERQRRAVEAIEEMGGWVQYDHQYDSHWGDFMGKLEPPVPAWLRRLVGDDLLRDVVFVSSWNASTNSTNTSFGDVDHLDHLRALTDLRHLQLSESQVTDAGLKNLTKLRKLELLWLYGTHITDAGLQSIEGLTDLFWLDLTGTQVTDLGLEHLKELKGLKWLELSRTQVTSQGIKELQEALPECKIQWTPPPTPKTNLDQN